MKRTLLLIFIFLALMIGSFIWFVVTWDASREDPLTFISPKIPLQEALAATAISGLSPTHVTWVLTHVTPTQGPIA